MATSGGDPRPGQPTLPLPGLRSPGRCRGAGNGASWQGWQLAVGPVGPQGPGKDLENNTRAQQLQSTAEHPPSPPPRQPSAQLDRAVAIPCPHVLVSPGWPGLSAIPSSPSGMARFCATCRQVVCLPCIPCPACPVPPPCCSCPKQRAGAWAAPSLGALGRGWWLLPLHVAWSAFVFIARE